MRSLIVISPLMMLSFSLVAGAAAPSAAFRTSAKSEKGSTGLVDTNANASIGLVSSVDLQSGTYFRNLDFRVGFERTKADYNRYLLTDRLGNQTELAKSFDRPEHAVRIGASAFLGQTTLLLDGSKTMGQSPFRGYAGTFGLNHELLGSGTKFLFTLSRSDYAAPASYYIDPDNFATRKRPERNLENRASVGAEQIFSETTKARIKVFAADKTNARPLQRGAEIGLAKAVSDSASLIGTLGLAREKRSDPLLDDRGFFGANWAQIEFRLQPSYRWEFAAKLGTILETESARGRLPKRRVGTDSLGLSAKTQWKFGEISANALGALSNTGYSAYTFGGNFTWYL